MARSLTIRTNPRRKRRVTRRRSTTTVYAPPRRRRRTRRRTSLAAPVRRRRAPRLSAPRRRRRSMATRKPDLLTNLIYMAGGAGVGWGVEYAVDQTGIIANHIASPTRQALARSGVTAGACLLAYAATKKSRRKTKDIVKAGSIGALAYSLGRTAKVLYDANVSTTGAGTDTGTDTGQGVQAALPRGAVMGNVATLNAYARRGMGAPARRGMGYVNPSPITGTAAGLAPNTIDGLDGVFNGSL